MAIHVVRKRRRAIGRYAKSPRPPAPIAGEAKAVAEALLSNLGALDCPVPVLGAAVAIVVGNIAAQIDAGARERFYEMFMLAVRESEIEFSWRRGAGRPRSLN